MSGFSRFRGRRQWRWSPPKNCGAFRGASPVIVLPPVMLLLAGCSRSRLTTRVSTLRPIIFRARGREQRRDNYDIGDLERPFEPEPGRVRNPEHQNRPNHALIATTHTSPSQDGGNRMDAKMQSKIRSPSKKFTPTWKEIPRYASKSHKIASECSPKKRSKSAGDYRGP